MNCFNHPDRAAVGICKCCGKGLCPDCAVDLGRGLACKGHEADVAEIHRYNRRAIRALKANENNPYSAPSLFFLSFSLLLIVLGFFGQSEPNPGLIAMGGLIFVPSIAAVIANRRTFGANAGPKE